MAYPAGIGAAATRAANTAASTAAKVKAASEAAIKAAAPPVSTAGFEPRTAFAVSDSITRSYYLGHHHAALNRMQKMLSNVGLIIECRDFRVPISSWNPLLERSLATSNASATAPGPGERARIIVYTKRDLAPSAWSQQQTQTPKSENASQSVSQVVQTLKEFHARRRDAEEVVFLGDGNNPRPAAQLLEAIKRVARDADSLTGLRAMVVGMPNAGKSTLLNKLRAKGMNLPKAAKTGAEPGVTRKLGTPVRIVPREAEDSSVTDPDLVGMGEGVFMVDTPGVFMPYVSSAEDMLKLSLVGCVKDGLISNVTVADYLLYHLNLADPTCYERFCKRPTNDVYEWLAHIARSTGKLAKFHEPNIEAAADWIVQEWRRGSLARFLLDVVTPETLMRAVEVSRDPANISMNQAKKKEKEARKARNEAKRQGAPSSSA